jgi:hypothetical protein
MAYIQPTPKLRWFVYPLSIEQGSHPSAFLVDGLPYARVLQQWCDYTESVEGRWQDIPTEYYDPLGDESLTI